MHFKRSLGPLGLMFTAIGGMIGSSWLFAPYYVAQATGPAAIFTWVLGAGMMLMIAMVFAELTCMLPVSGSHARFIYFSHGVLASFVFGWLLWLSYVAVAPIETLAIIQYMSGHYPGLMSLKEGVSVLSLSGYAMAALVLFLMCVLNFLSIKWLVRYNNLIVWVKLLVPVIVSVAVLAVSFHPKNFYQTSGGFFPYGLGGVANALSIAGVIFSYAGYAPAIALAGEAKNPQKVVPLVLVGSILICMLVYILLQIAFIGSHDTTALTDGWDALHFHKDETPLIGILEQLHLHALSQVVLVMAFLAPAGTALIFIATTARVSFAMSQNGSFPQGLLYLSRDGVPTLAVLCNFVAGMLLFIPLPSWQFMVSFLVAAFVMCYSIGPISLIALRTQLPGQNRPFVLPCYRLWAAVAFFFSNLIIYWTGWDIYYHLMLTLGVGFLVLILVRHFNPAITLKTPLEWQHSLWVFVYLLGMGAMTYLESRQSEPGVIEWQELLLIGLFTLVILYWSFIARLPAEIAKQRVRKVLKQHGIDDTSKGNVSHD